MPVVLKGRDSLVEGIAEYGQRFGIENVVWADEL
jgi:hypothetical protein